LILTDHRNHSAENSLYDLSIKMLAHPKTDVVDIATRYKLENNNFYKSLPDSELWATRINQHFHFEEDHPLDKNAELIEPSAYDLVWLRMPPPLDEKFFNYINTTFANSVIINNPNSIHETGSKKFLLNFSEICAPMKICSSLDEIRQFKDTQSIVLKPFNEYGGRGIVKIDNDQVSSNEGEITFEEFSVSYLKNPIDYLGVKYLKNVSQGDKRIIVVNGEILGASLRLPKEDSWLCNVALGGSSNLAEVEEEEKEMIKQIDPILSEKGIVMYGIDTLVNDEGKRVLSEINTTSIGGLPQIAAMRNEPLVEKAIDLIWEYYNKKMIQND